MTLEYEVVKGEKGARVYAYTKQGGGYRKKILLGTIKGNIFIKPHAKVYKTLNSVGMERSLLELLKSEGVVWVLLKVNSTWYPIPLMYWLKDYDEPVEYRGEIQHHLKLGRIRMLADAWRDSWEKVKNRG